MLVLSGAVFAGQAVRSTMRRMATVGTGQKGIGPTLTIAAQHKRRFPVNVVGVDYVASAPKKALALSLMMRVKIAGDDPAMMNDAINALIKVMFGADHIEGIQARLADEGDELDIDHLMLLMNKLIEAATGDPTT